MEVKEVDQKVKEVTPEEKGNEKAKDKKKKKKEKKQNLEEKKPEEPKEVPVAKPKAPVEAPKKDEKKPKERAPTVRTFPNGLEVHEISLGKPNAKQATAGKRVSFLSFPLFSPLLGLLMHTPTFSFPTILCLINSH